MIQIWFLRLFMELSEGVSEPAISILFYWKKNVGVKMGEVPPTLTYYQDIYPATLLFPDAKIRVIVIQVIMWLHKI